MSAPAARTDRDRPAERSRGLVDFATALRAGGARCGSAALMDANAALAAVGPQHRADVKEALRATLVRDPSDFELFELLFESFFPRGGGTAAGPSILAPASPNVARAPAVRRFIEARASHREAAALAASPLEADAAGSQSSLERLKTKDFEQMTAAELAVVQGLISRIAQALAQRRSRRSRPAGQGRRLDLSAMQRHRDLDKPRYRSAVLHPRESVLLVDVSGSMSHYSRVFLQLAHALSRGSGLIETFVFATRLSRITRTLRIAEPDLAIAAASRAVPDWDGGTRLGASLAEFNLRWGRRVLATGARVILLSDGLERDAIELLEREVMRLARTAYELIWINPLLRSGAYAPLAAGAQVLSRHVDVLRPAHNIDSLTELAQLLG